MAETEQKWYHGITLYQWLVLLIAGPKSGDFG